ncbi:hypothetical protein [Corynebacterium pseudopelargi]|uniref:RecT family protein n=1 Tax=Corynebacterium pseudopelargi TaxID=2080757 RepID=A0A3G6IX74_9CORY|nr:hypothetical protein [Corynebacterium pseudopelargi]AZA08730.1 hypothetical protein CPPEL_02995 [Corynebacterium pseudopelargi]
MSQELDTTTNNLPPAPAVANTGQTLMQKGVEKLRQHAELKAMAMDYADFITQTGNCPDIYRGKPADAAAAIIRGTALGFDPDGALEAFFVIKGKTGMYARAMIAVAENVGCRVWEQEATQGEDGKPRVTWCGTRPGSNKVETVTWDMKRAEAAGYATNGRYKTNGIEMLRAKCQAELARIIAPGALMGLYSEQEPTAFERPEPVKATATRLDAAPKQGGLDGVRAALGQKQEEPVIDQSVVQGFLQKIEDAKDRAELKAVSTAAKKAFDDDVPNEVSEAANNRWKALGDQ